MIKSKYNWTCKEEGIVSNNEIYSVILKNRHIENPDYFFSMGEEKLYNPFLIHQMDQAVKRIYDAIDKKEKIVVYGDYDCDGITAITVLYRTLKNCKAVVSYDLPNRFTDGYGLNMRSVEEMIHDDVKLVITVDNGITCIDEVARLKEAGIDTIITDHHQFKETLPDAFCILHPKLSPKTPFKEIAGVMVSYKLASALMNQNIPQLYDLVAIGTIADLMPLEDENQAMVNLGLKQLEHTTIKGLQKLVESSHIDVINETAIAFKIAPMINSSGRLGKAKEALQLLISDDESLVRESIVLIEENHKDRKDLTEEAFELCEKLVNPNDNVLVIHSPFLHEGVIGICAQRIADKYHKSTCVITLDEEGIGKGSMRSFGKDNILKMLEQNAPLLLRFGGHGEAAGLQIKEENIDLFRKNLQSLSTHHQGLELEVDMEVDISEVQIDTIEKLTLKSFFTALFLMRNLKVIRKQEMSKKHTKLVLESKGMIVEAIMFSNLEYYYECELGDIVNIVGGLSINEWRKSKSIQIMIKDLSCDGLQVLDFRDHTKFELGKSWIQSSLYKISDEIIYKYPVKTELKQIRPETIVILPKCYEQIHKQIVDKDLYREVYRNLPNESFDFSKIEKKVKIQPFVLEQILLVFVELGFLQKAEESYIKINGLTKTGLEHSKRYLQLVSNHQLVDWIYSENINYIKKAMKAWTEEEQQ